MSFNGNYNGVLMPWFTNVSGRLITSIFILVNVIFIVNNWLLVQNLWILRYGEVFYICWVFYRKSLFSPISYIDGAESFTSYLCHS